jgi:hypothetical protein
LRSLKHAGAETNQPRNDGSGSARERAQEALRVAESEVADWRRRSEELNHQQRCPPWGRSTAPSTTSADGVSKAGDQHRRPEARPSRQRRHVAEQRHRLEKWHVADDLLLHPEAVERQRLGLLDEVAGEL